MRASDFEQLAEAASDPGIWSGHPVKDRHKKQVFRDYFEFLLNTQETLVVKSSNGEMIGCSRFYVPPDLPDAMGIGFTFLVRAHWGGETNFELKRLMVGHVLKSFPSVWFHIDPSNMRSQIATQRLGAVHRYDATLILGPTPAAWKCYELTADAWSNTCDERSA